MIYIIKILDFSIYHLARGEDTEDTLCGLDLGEKQFELCNKLPEDRGFICSKCKRIKKRHELSYDLNQKREINQIQIALQFYGNAHVLFRTTTEMERTSFGLLEAIEFSSTYINDSLQCTKTTFEPSVNKNKIQVSYPLRGEIWNPEIEFSKLEYFSSVIKQNVFESLKERRN